MLSYYPMSSKTCTSTHRVCFLTITCQARHVPQHTGMLSLYRMSSKTCTSTHRYAFLLSHVKQDMYLNTQVCFLYIACQARHVPQHTGMLSLYHMSSKTCTSTHRYAFFISHVKQDMYLNTQVCFLYITCQARHAPQHTGMLSLYHMTGMYLNTQ